VDSRVVVVVVVVAGEEGGLAGCFEVSDMAAWSVVMLDRAVSAVE